MEKDTNTQLCKTKHPIHMQGMEKVTDTERESQGQHVHNREMT